MPFAGFRNFEACVRAQRRKGHSLDAARRICGKIQAVVEGKDVDLGEDEEAVKDALASMVPEEDVDVADPESTLAKVLAQFATPDDEDGEVEISECYITEDGTAISSDQIVKEVLRQCSMRGVDPDRIHREVANTGLMDVAKMVTGSTQSDAELGRPEMDGLQTVKVVEPPYPPELLSSFMEVDETHFRCCRAKMTDAVGRPYTLEPTEAQDGMEWDPTDATDAEKTQIANEKKAIREFIADCNSLIGFDGVLERAGLDHEGVGWAALEVVRSKDMKVRKLSHVPASRVRALRGFKGFVELAGPSKYIYYQPFGEKVVNPRRKDPTSGKPEPYNPREDGELAPTRLEWSMVDRETGEPTRDFAKAANELIWLPRHHPNTIYYGFTDVVPALGHLLANVHIRDFILQFFEHNTVPRYAVIIEGAKLADPVKRVISEYFSTHVKGKAHKTLIVPIPSMRGEVKVRFERLDADVQEASFQDTRKNNRDGIMTAHGVSPAIIGIAEHSELGSGKGLSQAEIYKDRIVTPSQRRWANALNRMFRLGLGVQMVSLKFDPLDIRDTKAEMEVLTGYQKNGDLTPNEVRQKAGLGDPYEEGGDRAFIMTTGGPVFVDEMTEEAGAERAALEDEIAGMKAELTAQRAQAAPGGPGQAPGQPPAPGQGNGQPQPAPAPAGPPARQ